MGDRGNVHINGVYLYTHWNGDELPFVVQKALKRRARWDDADYLARIVFCAMINGDNDSETGFGISSEICDNEHPIIELNCDAQTISFVKEGGETLSQKNFEEYAKMSHAELNMFLKAEVGW